MKKITQLALSLYRRLMSSSESEEVLDNGITTVLDGASAVAVCEACFSEIAVFTHDYANQSSFLAWHFEQQRIGKNFFEQTLKTQTADSFRACLNTAIGISLSGKRASLFAGADELLGAMDILTRAVQLNLPLIVHIVQAQSNQSTQSVQQMIQTLKNVGVMVFYAQNVQSASDFCLLSRALAEQCLVPVVIIQDPCETAQSYQEVTLPGYKLIKSFLGKEDETILSPNPAQQEIFGEERSRVPQWHNLNRPVLLGSVTDSAKALQQSILSREIFFQRYARSQVNLVLSNFQQLTKRNYLTVQLEDINKADMIFFSYGSSVETIRQLAKIERLQKNKIKIGIVAINEIQAADLSSIIESILKQSKAKVWTVLERIISGKSDVMPLMSMILSALNGMHANKKPQQIPKIHSLVCGLANQAIVLEDLHNYCQQFSSLTFDSTRPLLLGSESYPDKQLKDHPRLQSLYDNIKRHYPELTQQTLNAKIPTLAHNNYEQLSMAVVCPEDFFRAGVDLVHSLYSLLNGTIRTRIQKLPSQKKMFARINHSQQIPITVTAQLDYLILLDPSHEDLQLFIPELKKQAVLLLGFSIEDERKSLLAHAVHLAKLQAVDVICIEHKEPLECELEELSELSVVWEKCLATLHLLCLQKNIIHHKKRKMLALRQSLRANDASSEKLQQIFKLQLEQEISFYPLSDDTNWHAPQNSDAVVPPVIEQLANIDTAYDKIARFRDDYQAQASDSLLAINPYSALSVIPPLTAVFNRNSESSVPKFSARDCTVCGACWSHCPDSAIGVSANTPKQLLNQLIEQSKAGSLRQIVSKLSSLLSKILKQEPQQYTVMSQVLSAAFEQVQGEATIAEERLELMQQDFSRLLLTIENLPIVVSDRLFLQDEKKLAGSGSLFSLVINTDKCKNCGICISQCEQNNDQAALFSATDDQETLFEFNEQSWRSWQNLSDTPSELIQQQMHQQQISATAAIMMSRYHAFALSGGDAAEAGSGEKIALRQLLSVVEYHVQPIVFQQRQQLQEYIAKLKQKITENLSTALPSENLQVFAKHLSSIDVKQVELNELLEHDALNTEHSEIDVPQVRKWVNLVLNLKNYLQQLEQGESGLGRARYSLCIGSKSVIRWAGNFPDNPFSVPVCIDDSSELVQRAKGLSQGLMQQGLDSISLMRQARASIDTNYAKSIDKLSRIEWDDLTKDEKRLFPPLLVVVSDDLFSGSGLAQLLSALSQNYPLKFIVLQQLDGGISKLDRHQNTLQHRFDSQLRLALMAIDQKTAYVSQTSLAHPNHLQQVAKRALDYQGAALCCIYTPSPQRHGFSAKETVNIAKLAVESRAYPLFSYDPDIDGVLGICLSIDNNPDYAQTFSNTAIQLVHWAYAQKRFSEHFSVQNKPSRNTVLWTDWLKLNKQQQHENNCYFERQEAQKVIKIMISSDLAKMLDRLLQYWLMLQEFSGVVTPFTEDVEHRIKEIVKQQHQLELDQIRQEYEQKLAQLEQQFASQAHTKVRDQLLSLAGYEADLLRD